METRFFKFEQKKSAEKPENEKKVNDAEKNNSWKEIIKQKYELYLSKLKESVDRLRKIRKIEEESGINTDKYEGEIIAEIKNISKEIKTVAPKKEKEKTAEKEKEAGFNNKKTEAAIEKEIRNEKADIQKKAKMLAKSQSYLTELSGVNEGKLITKKTSTIEAFKDYMAHPRLNLEAKKEKKNTEKESNKKETVSKKEREALEKYNKAKKEAEKFEQKFKEKEEAEKKVAPEKIKAMVEKERKDLIEHIGSKDYFNKLLIECDGNSKEAKKMQKKRIERVATVRVLSKPADKIGDLSPVYGNNNSTDLYFPKWLSSIIEKVKGVRAGAFYDPIRHNIIIPDEYNDYTVEATRHELAHASTRGTWDIPERSKKTLKDSYKKSGDIFDDSYWGNSTERLARKQALDQEMERLHIKKYGEPITTESFVNLISLFNRNRYLFSEDARMFIDQTNRNDFIKIFNEIAQNENKKENDDNYKMAA